MPNMSTKIFLHVKWIKMIENKSELNVRGIKQMSLAQTRIIENIF